MVFRRQGSNIITGQEYSIVALPCNEFALSISPVEITHAGSYVCALDLPSGTLTDSVNIQIGSMYNIITIIERKFLGVTIVGNQVYVLINSLFLPLSPPLSYCSSGCHAIRVYHNRCWAKHHLLLPRRQDARGRGHPSDIVLAVSAGGF